jgi:hypothetical protein
MSAVDVLGVREIGKGQLAAVARVRIAGCVEFDVRIIQPDDDAPYIAMPQIPIRANGTGWKNAVAITSHDVMEDLRREVLAAWDEFLPPPIRGRRAWS